MSAFLQRCRRARDLMAQQGVDCLLVTISSDLLYLTGYTASVTPRLTMFVIPSQGEPTMVMPRLEVSKLEREGHEVFFRVVPWDETESPVAIIAGLVGDGPRTIAVSDTLWTKFFLDIQAALPDAKFVSGSRVVVPLRITKDEADQESIREVGRRMDRVFHDFCRLKFASRTERELAEDLFEIVRAHGLNPSKVSGVAAGPNSASAHHVSGAYRIKPQDALWIELGLKGNYRGYICDKTRCVHVGEPTDEYMSVYNTVRQAQETALASTRVGMECQEVDRIARKIIADAGYGQYFTHRVGHGLGLDSHEPPYMVEGNTTLIEPGMVFSIEPGIYLPGRFGIRIEDIVIMDDEVARSIYESSHDLVVVE